MSGTFCDAETKRAVVMSLRRQAAERLMKLLELVLIVVAAAALVIWRGVQLYNTGVKRRRL